METTNFIYLTECHLPSEFGTNYHVPHWTEFSVQTLFNGGAEVNRVVVALTSLVDNLEEIGLVLVINFTSNESRFVWTVSWVGIWSANGVHHPMCFVQILFLYSMCTWRNFIYLAQTTHSFTSFVIKLMLTMHLCKIFTIRVEKQPTYIIRANRDHLHGSTLKENWRINLVSFFPVFPLF